MRCENEQVRRFKNLFTLCASVIYTAIKLAVTSIAFWVKFAQSYLYMAYQLSTFVKYPITIYPAWIRGILTFIIPFAFTGYFPAAYILGKGSFLLGVVLTFVVSFISIFIAYRIWLIGIKRYESSGSQKLFQDFFTFKNNLFGHTNKIKILNLNVRRYYI